MQDVVDMMRKEMGNGAIDSLGLKVLDTFTVGIKSGRKPLPIRAAMPTSYCVQAT